MKVILIEGVVKGYHECPFTVRTSTGVRIFCRRKKKGDKGKAFRVVSTKEQLGHIQNRLVSVLWPLETTIEW